MSMLAEPRRKANWVLNPRNTHWTADSSKYGLRLMEKMGWSQGNGLGAKQQGSTEHIKVAVRSDNRGVGFKDRPEDVLLHQNDFSDLLQQLASETQPLEGSGDEVKPPVVASLEEKSQKSRSRVHYRKFTRGKDLSRYSEKDLASILGKPAPKTSAKTPAVKGEESAFSSDVVTVGGGNMLDYFRKKMTSLRSEKKMGDASMSEDSSETNHGNKFDEQEEKIETNGFQPVQFKKNKKKKSSEVVEQEIIDEELTKSKTLDVGAETKKEKKRRQKAEKALQNSEMEMGVEVTSNLEAEAYAKNDVKGKQKSIQSSSDCEQPQENDEGANDESLESKEKKRKKRKMARDENSCVDEKKGKKTVDVCSDVICDSQTIRVKKNKKSKKLRDNRGQVMGDLESKEMVETAGETKKKKKKKLKDALEEQVKELPLEDDVNSEVCVVETNEEKKRKRKSIEILAHDQDDKEEGKMDETVSVKHKKKNKRKKRKMDCDESVDVDVKAGSIEDSFEGSILNSNQQEVDKQEPIVLEANGSQVFLESGSKKKKKKKECMGKANELVRDSLGGPLNDSAFGTKLSAVNSDGNHAKMQHEMRSLVSTNEEENETSDSAQKESISKDSIPIVELNGKVYLNGICNYDLSKPAITNIELKKIPFHLRSGVEFLPIPGANNHDFSYVGLKVKSATVASQAGVKDK